VHDPQDGAAQPGSVLVVRSLEPALASALPGAAGLVAETGSVLSHLAILARELAVPTVVNVSDALERFPPGATVVVDGSTGEVTRLHEVGR
jgi:pyruvate,water dikinase